MTQISQVIPSSISLFELLDEQDITNILVSQESLMLKWQQAVEEYILRHNLDAHIHIGVVSSFGFKSIWDRYKVFSRTNMDLCLWCSNGKTTQKIEVTQSPSIRINFIRQRHRETFLIVDHPQYMRALVARSINSSFEGVVITNPNTVRDMQLMLSEIDSALSAYDSALDNRRK